MSDRTIRITLAAEVAAFRRNLGAAAASARATAQSVEKLARDNERDFTRVGKASILMGAALAAGLALSVRAATEWETAWAGVTKTVDGTASEMADLERSLRDLTKVLPASHKEIAGVAEAAGQLGIQRDAIVGFTRVMVDLGETTNLTAEQAATSIAQLANVMQTSAGDIDNLGATLVALGNNGASTEREILEMAARLAGAGQLIGASEADVLAMANAMASMGIEAQLGGGAMSRVLLKIYTATKTGGDELDRFAAAAGMSAEAFAEAFGANPARALDTFIQGLDGIDKAGGNVMQALSDLGIEGTQDLQVLLRLKGAGDLLSESLTLGAQAWEANTALAEEAAKRYDTTAAKTQLAKNALNELAIGIGSTLLPAVAGAAGAVGDLAGFISSLPGPVQGLLAALATLTATVGLLGGAALVAAPKLAALRTSLVTLGLTASATDKVMKGLTATMKGGLIVAAAAGVGAAMFALIDSFAEAAPAVDELRLSLVAFQNEGQVSGALAQVVGDDFSDMARKVQAANRSKWFSVDTGRQEIIEARKDLENLDAALVHLVQSGQGDAAARIFGRMQTAVEQGGGKVSELRESFAGYGAAVLQAEADTAEATDGIEGVGGAAGEAATALDELTDAQKRLQTALGSFSHPLQTYQRLIEEATESDRERAEKSAEAFNDGVDSKIKAAQREYDGRLDAMRKTGTASDAALQKVEDQRDAEIEALQDTKRSWEDYATAVTVSLKRVAEELEKENKNHEEWKANLVKVAQRAGVDVAQILADMGEEGVDLTAKMATGTEAEVKRMAAALIENSRIGGEDAARALDNELRVMALIAQTGGKATVEQLAAALELGVAEVEAVAKQYGVVLKSEAVTAGQDAGKAFAQWFAQSLRDADWRGMLGSDLGQLLTPGGLGTAPGSKVYGDPKQPSGVGDYFGGLVPSGARVPTPAPSLRIDPASLQQANGRAAIGSLTIQTQTGATAQDIAEEVAFQARLGAMP